MRTTPARPVDVEALFPEVTALRRIAVRLHPRAGTPQARESSLGGPVLWPRSQPWPHCEDTHPAIIGDGLARPITPVPLVPVLQLFARDVPDWPFPAGTVRDVIVYVTGNDWCSSDGCYALLLEPEGHTFRVITHFTFINLPIRVLDSTTHGWHDLTVQVRDNGQRSRRVILKFNGETYPGNPSAALSVLPEDDAGSTELPLAKTDGALLFVPPRAPAAATEPPALAASQTARPSFDCSRARTHVEHLICGNAALARADRVMAALYRHKLAANPARRAEVKSAQRAKIKPRESAFCRERAASGHHCAQHEPRAWRAHDFKKSGKRLTQVRFLSSWDRSA